MRRIAISRRFDLADISVGWDKQCFIDYRPATYNDLTELRTRNIEELDDKQADAALYEYLWAHIVKGRVLVHNDDGEAEIVDMTRDDLEQFPIGVLRELMRVINKGTLDPKVSAANAASSQETADSPTET